ncbi:MAG: Transcriptional regulatory protein ZraR [Candidatus Hydrogenedentes bacterium ADurb.Bin101]|nr:MAG: Transcriptional regulatory protein ZraR [Candidatus Hydrogenedentes bacterium ADurb.Bin101]
MTTYQPDITDSILESISDGVFTVDEAWKVTSFNRAAEEITGIPREEALGKRCWEVFRASMCEMDCALKHTMDTGKRIINRSCYIIDAGGQRIPISVSTALLRDAEGQVIGGAETFRDLSLVEELRKEITGRFQIGDMVSRSDLMRRLFDVLPQIAASDSSVLIQGETGTGKELLARAVHSMSRRAEGPFVAVNCGALPDTLLESELFGYKAGAFTGADKDKPGRFAAAEGGTLFLDEIGDITPALQVRLLRVLQEHIYEPLGSNTPVRTDVRLITAGNRDLAELVETGGFRRDLYYRINVVRLELPPLRKRKEDVPLLVEHFIVRFNRVQNRDIQGVTSAAMAVLMAHDYPGNIRELENIIEHAFVLCAANKDIDIPCLPDYLARRAHPDTGPVPMGDARKALEAQLILETLERNHGNRQAAARELGMHKSTLFRKMRALHLPYARPASLPKKSQ